MRRLAVTLLLLALLPVPLAVETQEHKASKPYRLGVLTPGARPVPSFPTTAHLLPVILREFGYVEGQNLVIEQRFAEGKLVPHPVPWTLVRRGDHPDFGNTQIAAPRVERDPGASPALGVRAHRPNSHAAAFQPSARACAGVR